MEIKEVIEHCNQVAKYCTDCADENRQLASWLSKLRKYSLGEIKHVTMADAIMELIKYSTNNHDCISCEILHIIESYIDEMSYQELSDIYYALGPISGNSYSYTKAYLLVRDKIYTWEIL